MERQDLKLIFSEIIEGYSLVNSPTFGDLKIKHINNFDSAQTDIRQDSCFKKAVKEGLPEREDKIKYLIEEKLWDSEPDVFRSDKAQKVIQSVSQQCSIRTSLKVTGFCVKIICKNVSRKANFKRS